MAMERRIESGKLLCQSGMAHLYVTMMGYHELWWATVGTVSYTVWVELWEDPFYGIHPVVARVSGDAKLPANR